MRATAEAMVELFFLTDGEGGRFFAVEWAERLIITPRFFQWEFAVDYIDNIDPI